MAKDPAFLFYPADASEDTQFMSRIERGCYFDLLKAQKKFNRFSLENIKKVLGRDFETCWDSIKIVLKEDADGYFIEWVNDSIEKRKLFTESRRQNRSRANNSELFIYLMFDEESGRYKIGSSINPDRRLIELKSKFPTISLLHTWGKTAQTTESELHQIFSDKKVFNEFFELTTEDIEHMIEHMCVHMKLHMDNHMVNEIVNENEIILVNESKKEKGQKIEISCNPAFLGFQAWIKDNASNVGSFKLPFTETEYLAIEEKYEFQDICDLLLSMHNYKDLFKKNISANLTFQNWARRNNLKDKKAQMKY